MEDSIIGRRCLTHLGEVASQYAQTRRDRTVSHCPIIQIFGAPKGGHRSSCLSCAKASLESQNEAPHPSG
jgi:hypothetical protein